MDIRNFLLNSFLLPQPFETAFHVRGVYDFIVPQGFGRNTYPDSDYLLRIRNWFRRITGRKTVVSVCMVGALRDSVGNDIDAFQKLGRLHFDPGRPNEILAEICVNLMQKKRVPIIGQWEVMYAIWKRFPMWYCLNQDRFIAIWPPRTGYLATRGMLLEAKRIADERGLMESWSFPCLVAHPEHMPRVFFLARNIFGELLAKMTEVMSNEWFDPRSVQWWTRDKWRWLVYEMLTRAHHRWFGWF